MSRSAKQLRSDLNRINLETKSLNRQMEIMARQYEKLGRKIPQRIIENRATERDIHNYWNTINNAVNRRVERQELESDKGVNRLLVEYNKIQADRKSTVKNLLDGYGSNFVNEFSKGKQAILGRDSSFSITSTDELSLSKVQNKAKRTKQSPVQYLKKEINSLKKDLQNLKEVNKNERGFIANQIKELIETQGFSLSDDNMKKIKSKLNSTDWLGSQKIIKTINGKIESAFYSIYKQSLEGGNNAELLDSIFSDINKSSHSKMTMYSKIMGT